jgi:hypothetical protein
MKTGKHSVRGSGLVGAAAVACAVLALLHTGCGQPDPNDEEDANRPAWFEDVTERVGLKFMQDAGPLPVNGLYSMPQTAGSGAALLDYDNDGRLDIYLIQNGGPEGPRNQLFHQEKDGSFTDVSAGSGLDIAGYGMGVAVGDVNNDGLPDVLVTEYGRIRLFLNQGNGKFKDVTKEAGLEGRMWGTSAAFFDYDRDGWLDLVVACYVNYDPNKKCKGLDEKPDYCGPQQFEGTVSRLYHNSGPATPGGVPRFEDVTKKAGFDKAPGPGLGIVVADFNGDHWPDVLISNDGKPNHLWINQKDGTFLEQGRQFNIAYDHMGKSMAGMGIAIGDFAGDRRLSIYMPHLDGETNTLWTQTAPGKSFRDDTLNARVASGAWRGTGFGAVFADFNQDGELDLALVNGGVQRGLKPDESCSDQFWKWYVQRNQLFMNEGGGKFKDISASEKAFSGTPLCSRGLACGDINGDGALDLLVSSIAGPARLYYNVVPNRGHWLMIRAVDPALSGRDAYGAELTLTAGGRRWTGLIQPAYSYMNSNDPRAHFGLGQVEKVDSIHIVWPDGKEEVFPSQAADQFLVLRKGAGAMP